MPGIADVTEKIEKVLKMKSRPGRPKKVDERKTVTGSYEPSFWEEMKQWSDKLSVKGQKISASEAVMVLASLGAKAIESEPGAAGRLSDILHRVLALNQPLNQAIVEASKSMQKEKKKEEKK